MFLKTEYFNLFVEAASQLYSTRAPVEAVLISSGIPVQAVNLGDTGISMWNSAVSYADKYDKHKQLLQSIEREYGNNIIIQKLKKAIEDGTAFITEESFEEFIKPNLLPSTANVFLIYSKSDLEVEELKIHLDILTYNPAKAMFFDMHEVVAAGGEIRTRQLEYLGASDIVLLCLTPQFFKKSTQDCMSLAFTAKQMRKWLVPVLLKPCLWDRIKFLENIHPLPTNGLFVTQWPDPNDAYVAILNGLIEAINFIKKEK